MTRPKLLQVGRAKCRGLLIARLGTSGCGRTVVVCSTFDLATTRMAVTRWAARYAVVSYSAQQRLSCPEVVAKVIRKAP